MKSLVMIRPTLFLISLVMAVPVWSADLPAAPCAAAAPVPAFAPSPSQPALAAWHGRDLPVGWQPDPCLGWPGGHAWSTVIAVAGRFTEPAGVEGILTRLGAISTAQGIRYWSHHDQSWQTLILASTALDHDRPRADFSAAELRAGPVEFSQIDSRTGRSVRYRLRLVTAQPGRVVATVENVTSIWFLVFRLLAAGELVSSYSFEEIEPGVWGYHNLIGVVEPPLFGFGSSPASYLNRAVAAYRHLTGLPTDLEPPALRE